MVRASIGDGWATFRRHAGLLVGIQVLLWTASAIDVAVHTLLQREGEMPIDPSAVFPEGFETVAGHVLSFAAREATTASTLWWITTFLLFTLPMGTVIYVLALELVRGRSDVVQRSLQAVYRRLLPLLGVQFIAWLLATAGAVLAMLVIFVLSIGIGLTAGALELDLAWILLFATVAVALVLLALVPLFVVSIGIMQAPLLVVDRRLGPIEAIRGSWAMMRGYKWAGFRLAVATMIIMFLGLLALGIGLFVAIPVTWGAHSAFYDRVLAANPPPILGRVDPDDVGPAPAEAPSLE